MRFRDLDLNLLVVLDALLAEENVSRVATRLNLTQPAISSSLSRLRQHFDDELLVKRGRRMLATPLADSLRDPIRQALIHFQSIADRRANFDPATAKQRFVIVASDYVAATLLADVTAQLEAVAPNVVIVSRSLTERNIDGFVHGDWDLMITPRAPVNSDISSRLLFRERFTCIACAKNKSVGDSITLPQYLSQSHVVVEFDQPSMLALDEKFLSDAGHRRRVGVVVPHFTLMPAFVAGTSHIATIHRRLAQKVAKTLPVRIVRPKIAFPSVDEMLCWHPHKDQEAGNVWLRDFLIKSAAGLDPE